MNLNIRELKISDLFIFSKLVDKERVKLYRKWFETGYRCMAYIENDVPLSFLWFSTVDTGDQGITGFVVPVVRGECYLFDWYTLPSRRGTGIMGRLVRKTFIELKNQGILWAKWLFDKDNLPTQKISKRIGCEIAGNIKLIQIMGIQRINLKAIKGTETKIKDASPNNK